MSHELNETSSVEETRTVTQQDNWVYWLGLLGILAATIALRWRLLDVPLERDEGEFAYMAQQLLRGVPPYVSGYAMKMPGIYVAYAGVLTVFGESIRGIHLGLLAVNQCSIVLLFLLTKRLYGPLVGLIAAGSYAADARIGGGSMPHKPSIFSLCPSWRGCGYCSLRSTRPMPANATSPRPDGCCCVARVVCCWGGRSSSNNTVLLLLCSQLPGCARTWAEGIAGGHGCRHQLSLRGGAADDDCLRR